MAEKVLVNGLGTVGSRITRLVASLDVPIVGVKRTAKIDDVKTQELLKLYEDYGDLIDLYITPGMEHWKGHERGYEERKKDFEKTGLEVQGSTNDLPFDEIEYFIDAVTKKAEIKNYEKIYSEHPETNFMIQGGGEEKLVDHNFYLSAPNATGAQNFEELSKKNIKQVSCNTTFGSTALGLILEEESPENIEYIKGNFIRRQKDPGTKKDEPLKNPVVNFGTHHGDDIGEVVPQLEDKIIPTFAAKCPWTYAHLTDIDVLFSDSYDFASIKKTFEEYPRAALLETGFEMEDIQKGVKELMIPGGDSLFPMYHLRQPENGRNMLEIVGLTPQRSIVTPSAADMVVKKVLEPDASWEEAFAYTNEHARWHGYKFNTLKKDLEYKLKPKI